MVDSVIIKGALLWDGTRDKVLPEGAVLVTGEQIMAVGPEHEILSSHYDRVLEWPGATLLPGLIDCHNHLSMDPTLENYLEHMNDGVAELVLRATVTMRRDLYAGVTTSRCCGDKEFLDIACREAVQNELVEGPRLLVATRGIRASHGHGFVGYPFDGAEQIRLAIRENLAAGADFTKLYVTGTLKGGGRLPSYLSNQEIRLAIEESHQAGVRTAAHCVGGSGLDWCLEAGLDSLEHAYHINDAQIEQLARSETWLVLTPSPLLTETRVRHLPPNLIAGHLTERNEVAGRMAATVAAGVDFAVGTDAMHGGMAQEVAYLVDLGATPQTALTAATINGAKVCGLEREVGTLESGKYADIIAVDGNPLEDITALQRVVAVMKHGCLVVGASRASGQN